MAPLRRGRRRNRSRYIKKEALSLFASTDHFRDGSKRKKYWKPATIYWKVSLPCYPSFVILWFHSPLHLIQYLVEKNSFWRLWWAWSAFERNMTRKLGREREHSKRKSFVMKYRRKKKAFGHHCCCCCCTSLQRLKREEGWSLSIKTAGWSRTVEGEKKGHPARQNTRLVGHFLTLNQVQFLMYRAGHKVLNKLWSFEFWKSVQKFGHQRYLKMCSKLCGQPCMQPVSTSLLRLQLMYVYNGTCKPQK